MILADGIIGQMMEKVVLPPFQDRLTEEEIRKKYPWAALGKLEDKDPTYITSLELLSEDMERVNLRLQARYRDIEATEVRYEAVNCDDAEYIFVAFGTMARVCQKAVQLARDEGIKAGLLRPITLYPFPYQVLNELADQAKGFISIEMNAGQMVEDLKLAVEGKSPVQFYGRMGGIVPSPDEALQALKSQLIAK